MINGLYHRTLSNDRDLGGYVEQYTGLPIVTHAVLIQTTVSLQCALCTFEISSPPSQSVGEDWHNCGVRQQHHSKWGKGVDGRRGLGRPLSSGWGSGSPSVFWLSQTVGVTPRACARGKVIGRVVVVIVVVSTKIAISRDVGI